MEVKYKKYNEVIIKKDYAILIVKHKEKVLEVLIDIEDAEKVRSIGSWHALYDKTLKEPSYYIVHRKNPYIRLHRFIMNCPKDKVIDHINHNTLDNRKQNLRICTHFENQQNLRSKKTEQTGVYYRQDRNIWVSNITYNKKKYSKDFKTKDDAIKQRKEWEKLFYQRG